MGGIEFKPAKFLEHLVVIILDCGDKLFSSSYRDTHALMGKPSACQCRSAEGSGALGASCPSLRPPTAGSAVSGRAAAGACTISSAPDTRSGYLW